VNPYTFGPCTPWTPVFAGGTCNVLLETGAAAVSGVAVQAASEVLYHLTAQRFGTCEVTLRPCRRSCYDAWPGLSWWEYGTYPRPYWYAGVWYNMGCGVCGDSCSCVGIDEAILPGPVDAVTSVKVDGVTLTYDVNYRIDDYRKLVRIDGMLWPFCQDLTLPDTEVGTWSATVSYGEPVPALGQLAVGQLTSEIIKYLLCLDCQLPQGVVDVNRQGIGMTIANISELFNTGFIQLRICDLFIKTANPNHLQARSAVYDLDSPQNRAVGTLP
jgi:hypothetical protein